MAGETATGKKYTRQEWLDEATRRFGPDPMKWKFVCPSCGFVASTQDYKNAGAESGNVAVSCVGRWDGQLKTPMFTKPGPCNYAGFGLIHLNPVTVMDEKGQ